MQRIIVMALLLCGFVATAEAQKVREGGVNGELRTFFAVVPDPAPAQVVMFTTPSTGRFVLQQFCVSEGPYVVGTVAGWGDIPKVPFSEWVVGHCTDLGPGWVLPQNTDVTCRNGHPSEGGKSCIATVVETK